MPNKQYRKTQRLFNNVTKSLLTQNNGLKRDPETGVLYEEPLKDEHPGLDLTLMYAQPGNIITKTLAPSMAKGIVEGIRNGDTQQAILSMLIPEEVKGVELLADPKYFSTSRIKLKTPSAEFGPTIMRDGEPPLVK